LKRSSNTPSGQKSRGRTGYRSRCCRQRGISRLCLLDRPQMKRLELLDSRGQRGARHQVGRAFRLREGDEVADVILLGEHCNRSVDAHSDAPVWWRTEFESIEHVAEAFSGRLVADLEETKHLLLLAAVVDPYAAAADLLPVAGEVVGVAPDPCRLSLHQGQV